MNNLKCDRCKENPAEYICKSCTSLKLFCSKCDDYVHSLPYKKMHLRDSVVLLIKNNASNEERIKEELNKSKFINDLQGHTSYASHSYNRIVPVNIENRHYTRDYVNELIRVADKEKEELVYKNSALQTSLDRIKNSFLIQLEEVQREKEELNKQNLEKIKLLTNEHANNIKNLANEKDEIIKGLNKQIEEFKSCNEELITSFKDNIKFNKEEDNKTKNKLVLFNKALVEKNNTIKDLEEYYEEKIEKLIKKSNSEKNDIILKYERENSILKDNINRQKDNYEKLVEDQENQLNLLHETLRREEQKYKLLKEENDDKNKSLNFIRLENENFIKDISMMKKNTIEKEEYNQSTVEMLTNEIKSQDEHINCLKNRINNLASESSSLNIKNKALVRELETLEHKNNILARENEELRVRLDWVYNK